MTNNTFAPGQKSLQVKESIGWWIPAGDNLRRARAILTDGAFKLFASVYLDADPETGRYQATQKELAASLRKSKRAIGTYVREVSARGICRVSLGHNQFARTTFEICDEYWPYRRPASCTAWPPPATTGSAYVDAIRKTFLEIGCGSGRFSASDEKTGAALEKRGVPLALVQDAILVGTCRKYISWLNNGSSEPIASLRYFEGVIAEIQEQPLPAGYTDHLRGTVERLAKTWHKSAPARKSSAGEGGSDDGLSAARA